MNKETKHWNKRKEKAQTVATKTPEKSHKPPNAFVTLDPPLS